MNLTPTKTFTMKIAFLSLLQHVLVSMFVGLFTYAGCSKLLNLATFENSLHNLEHVANYASLLKWLVPLLEISIAFLIVLPSVRKTGLIISVVYLALLTALLSYLIAFAYNLPCTCMGLFKSLRWNQQLALNIFLLSTCAFSIRLNRDTQYHIAINSQKFRPEQL